jgi:tetratricopeptide (TPR) repeat protein
MPSRRAARAVRLLCVALFTCGLPAELRAETAASRNDPVPPLGTGAQALLDRAVRFEQEGRYADAAAAYTDAIRLDAGDGAALVALGKLRVRLGQLRDAEELFSAATRFRGHASAAYFERGKLRRALGREREAVADLESAANLAPDDAAQSEELAALYVARRAWLPALAAWRRALAVAADPAAEKRANLQVKALRVIAAELDPASADASRKRSFTRRALAKIAAR